MMMGPEFPLEVEALEARHDLVSNQLELIGGWVETLSSAGAAECRQLQHRIVEFLQRYVLVDAAWEEEHLFPLLGERASVFAAEHKYVARWVGELDALAHGAEAFDAVRFRRTTYKLIGLLEAHMNAEERAALHLQAPEIITTVAGAPAEIT